MTIRRYVPPAPVADDVDLAAAIDALPRREAIAVVLTLFCDLTLEDLGAVFEMTRGGAFMLRERAFELLRAHFGLTRRKARWAPTQETRRA